MNRRTLGGALELLEPMEPYVSEQSKSLSVDSSLRILANQ